MAPEVLRGEPLDARADVYATGVVLYECLTGQPPFNAAGSGLLVVTHVLESPPEDPRRLRPDLPSPLADLVLTTMAKDPDARPPSAEALERLLAAFA
jgi:serine/threonine protein kinase